MDDRKIIMEYQDGFRNLDLTRKTGRKRRKSCEECPFEKSGTILGSDIPVRIQVFTPGYRVTRQGIRQRLFQSNDLLRLYSTVSLRIDPKGEQQQAQRPYEH